MNSKTYQKTITDFQERWEQNRLDLMELAMVLDASKTVLESTLNRKATTVQIIEFAKVVAQQLK